MVSSDYSQLKELINELRSIFNMEKDGDYFEIYKKLSEMNGQTDYENLAVQEYCLNLICTDLAEHGDTNLYMYAGGKMLVSDFEKLHNDVLKKLLDLLKKNDVKNTLVWQTFGRIPMRFRNELGLS
jgi:hypothetical protein